MSTDVSASVEKPSPVRVVLHEEPEGVYAFAFSGAAQALFRDDLYDSLDDAKRFCFEDCGIPFDAWSSVSE